MSQSHFKTTHKTGAISPQTLLRGTKVETWQQSPIRPTSVTQRFFVLPPVETAHAAVRWAYGLSWVGLAGVPITLLGCLTSPVRSDDLIALVVGSLFWSMLIWLNRGLRRGSHAAWYLQTVFSLLALFMWLPLSVPIYGYILSQWFKPEVKAWFDLQ